MRDRQTGGYYSSMTIASAAPGRRATAARAGYMTSTPTRRTFMDRFHTPGDGESLPSLAEGRRYVLSWGSLGVGLATVVAFAWLLIGGAKGSYVQLFPWALWSTIVLLCVGYAGWNMWYLKQLVAAQHQRQQMVMQEKAAHNYPRERMFEQIITAASNADPYHTAARINAILRIPDFVLTRGPEGVFFRPVGCGLLGTILMEVNAIERDGELDRNAQMVKQAVLRVMMNVKEHLNGITLQHVNLSGLDLSFANLSGADLSFSHLAEANLEETNLQAANLESCELQKANLESCELQGAKLHNAILFEANLSSARLRGAHARYTNFQQAIMRQAELTEADLREANLQYVNLEGAQLRFADLRNASLRGAILRNADLEGADLEGADLEGADLEGARTQGANIPS